MRLVIFYFDFLPYHVARCRALIKAVRSVYSDEVFIYSIRPKSPDLPMGGCHSMLGDSVRVLLSSDEISLNSQEAIASLRCALDQDQPDAVAIPGYRTRVCRTALSWCKRNGRVAVLMSESRREDKPRKLWIEALKRLLVKQFDAALVGGHAHASYVISLGIPRDQVFLGCDVVDNEYWAMRADDVRQMAEEWRWGMNLPKQYFVASGRFIPKKNFECLLRAFARYRHQAGKLGWDLVLCGTGPLEIQLKQVAADLGLQDSVHFPGYLEADKLSIIYALASTFVMPSAYDEQWGLVVNEAMATGLPVLVSRAVGSSSELVQNGINGFIFDLYNESQLAGFLSKVTAMTDDERGAMAAASRRIIADWSPERYAEALLQAVEAGLSRQREQPTPIWIRRTIGMLLGML